DVYLDESGCDSLVVTTLSILPPISTTNNVQICTGSSYSEGTSMYSEAGTYTDVYQTIAGCDSLVITVLEINDFVSNSVTLDMCEGETYYEGTSAYSTSGTYEDLYTTVSGCDSLVISTLTFHPEAQTEISTTICAGEIYIEGINNYSETGIYSSTYQTIWGCDSVVVLDLLVLEPIVSSQFQEMCEGEQYTVGTSTYTASGTFSDTLTSYTGCDSTVTTVLEVHPLEFMTNSITICAGETHYEGSSAYAATGIYTNTYSSVFGCDSTVTTQLTVLQNQITEQTEMVCEGAAIPDDFGHYVAAENHFIDSLQSFNGCDSLIYTFIEYVDPGALLPSEVEICEDQSFMASMEGFSNGFDILWSTGSTSEFETLSDEGLHWVDISSENCNASDSIYIHVHEYLISPELESEICMGYNLTLLIDEPDATIEWPDQSEGKFYTVSAPGFYTASAINACGTFFYNYSLEEVDCNCKIYIPNAFTADGDALNEQFTVVNDCDFESYELSIFNRWGQVVFTTIDPNKSWNGSHMGGDYLVPDGIYTYMIKYSSRDPENNVYSNNLYGSVTIIR
ncbi:MAG: gliding motility-associated C-terminal domain-containing protein, partial [Flavobacteriales bacterium]